MDQIVLREPISAEPKFENMGVELLPFFNSVLGAAGSHDGREREFVGRNGSVKHLGVEVEAVSGGLGGQVGSDDGVVDEGVRVWNCVEQLEGVAEIARRGEGAELEDATDGIVVGGEAEADDLGVELLELGHGGA